jgi:formate/nitrite transporter FocA (FNT family)
MSGRAPDDIWQDAVEEGERRVARATSAMLATGFVGGADIMLGVLAMTATAGALTASIGEQPARLAGALAFGLGFVFLLVGRGELFTENFLVPVSTLLARKASPVALARLWSLTFVANYVGILVIALMLGASGVVSHETLVAAGPPADILTARSVGAAFLSAVLAGAVMTLLTWLAHAAEQDVSRILLALGIGFLLATATMNHAVVSFGETSFAYIAGTTQAGVWDIVRTLAVAIAGNLVGGLGLVTVTRLVQARGEPVTSSEGDSDRDAGGVLRDEERPRVGSARDR